MKSSSVARNILNQAEDILEISKREDLFEGKLRLGVTKLLPCTWLHAYLMRIKSEYHALNIELTVDLSRKLDDQLNASQLDLAIQTAPFTSHASGMVIIKLRYTYVKLKKYLLSKSEI